MRIVLVLCTFLLAGCVAASTPTASRSSASSPPTVSAGSITMPLTTSDAWRRMQQSLQSPVDVYTAAWNRALRGANIQSGAVGVAALAQGDDVNAFCADAQSFSITGATVVACGAVHAGPDPLPQAALILIPYDFYIRALPNMGTNTGQEIGRRGTALLLARAYALYVVDLLARAGIRSARADCVAGMTLRSFLPSMSGQQWLHAVAFAGRFTIASLLPPDMHALEAGYGSGSLRVCT